MLDLVQKGSSSLLVLDLEDIYRAW